MRLLFKSILSIVLLTYMSPIAAQDGETPAGTPRSETFEFPAVIALERRSFDDESGYRPPDEAPDDVQLWCTVKDGSEPLDWQGSDIILHDNQGYWATRLENVCVWLYEGANYDERIPESYHMRNWDFQRWWVKSWIVFTHNSRTKVSSVDDYKIPISFEILFDDVNGDPVDSVRAGKYGRTCGRKFMTVDEFSERIGPNRDFSLLSVSNSGYLFVSYTTRINWNC